MKLQTGDRVMSKYGTGTIGMVFTTEITNFDLCIVVLDEGDSVLFHNIELVKMED